MIENKALGERIRARRKELKLTQTQLAELTGYSDKTAISKIEGSHTDLNQTKIMIFADALQTSPQYLMGWTEDPKIKTKADFMEDELMNIRLLINFGKLTKTQQTAVFNMIESMAKEGET